MEKEIVKRGDIFRHYKGEKVGVTKVTDKTIFYIDLETGEQFDKPILNFTGNSMVGVKRFVFLEHIQI